MSPIYGSSPNGRTARIADTLRPELKIDFEKQYHRVKDRLKGKYIQKRRLWQYFYEWENQKAAIIPVHKYHVDKIFLRRNFAPHDFYKPNYVISSYGYFLLLRHHERNFDQHSAVTRHSAKKTPKFFPVELIPTLLEDSFQEVNNHGLVSVTSDPISIEGGHFSLVSLDPAHTRLNNQLAISAFSTILMGYYGTYDTQMLDKIVPWQDRVNEALAIFSPFN